MTTKWPVEREAELRRRWAEGEKPTAIRANMNLTRGQLAGRITRWNLHSPPSRARNFNPEHPAVLEGRTRFRDRVTDEGEPLKPGRYSQKLGDRITKGRWKGFPIYSLTLEERKTCPTTCRVWTTCYGDHMRWANRMRHGPEFEARLWAQLASLQQKHPRGFAVRLHSLGDFMSTEYVDFWEGALIAFPALRVFGYSAWGRESAIGAAVADLRDRRWSRFAVRTSGAPSGPRTMVIPRGKPVPAGVVVCPAQSEDLARRGKVISCSSCALCWQSKVPIGFLQH